MAEIPMAEAEAPMAEAPMAEAEAPMAEAPMADMEAIPLDETAPMAESPSAAMPAMDAGLAMEASPLLDDPGSIEVPPSKVSAVATGTPSQMQPPVSPSKLQPGTPSKVQMPSTPSKMQPPTSPSQVQLPTSPSKVTGLQPPPSRMSAVAPASAPAAPAATVMRLSPEALAKLVVVRGLRTQVEYPIYEGMNYIGRFDENPVDIDITDQESPTEPQSSRQHACVTWEGGSLFVEDMNSANGTFVNRVRLTPSQKKQLRNGDFIQTGTVMFLVKL
ncbi:MAG: FHA domain-containing protein [Planctomycetia bacterium]|nr:FHA domain-containing protein [Planctomycetia bacterium]